MVKTFVAAAIIAMGFGGYAVAQGSATDSPAGAEPMHVHHHSMHPTPPGRPYGHSH